MRNTHRAPGAALFTSKQEAKVAKGRERKFLAIVARNTSHVQGSLFKHKNTEGIYHKPFTEILALQRHFLKSPPASYFIILLLS